MDYYIRRAICGKKHSTSEVICAEDHTWHSILAVSSHLQCIIPANACLLGSPTGGLQSTTKVLSINKQALELIGECLKLLYSHDALVLLKNALVLSKTSYIYCTAPCFGSPILADQDRVQGSLLEAICNVNSSKASWKASLTIQASGLGIRKFTMLVTPALLESDAGFSTLSKSILPPSLPDTDCPYRAEALTLWSQ